MVVNNLYAECRNELNEDECSSTCDGYLTKLKNSCSCSEQIASKESATDEATAPARAVMNAANLLWKDNACAEQLQCNSATSAFLSGLALFSTIVVSFATFQMTL
mmetsp:Transcript_29597/g.35957  ORF Transcript_29597/g.35957 Transcript_29597/m.35957 type:complete len:105 (+) Transcript_29597:55-369(+)